MSTPIMGYPYAVAREVHALRQMRAMNFLPKISARRAAVRVKIKRRLRAAGIPVRHDATFDELRVFLGLMKKISTPAGRTWAPCLGTWRTGVCAMGSACCMNVKAAYRHRCLPHDILIARN